MFVERGYDRGWGAAPEGTGSDMEDCDAESFFGGR